MEVDFDLSRQHRTYCVGADVGFRKTGLTAFLMLPEGDRLVEAVTIESTVRSAVASCIDGDLQAVWSLLSGIGDFLTKYHPVAVFAELPHGGSQGARAGRCMGLATGMFASLSVFREEAFELFSPLEVETALGIRVEPVKRGAPKHKKGEGTKLKKERLKNIVLAAWPSFKGWPEKVALAEDAYDSAGAFLCGRSRNDLYGRVRKVFEAQGSPAKEHSNG